MGDPVEISPLKLLHRAWRGCLVALAGGLFLALAGHHLHAHPVSVRVAVVLFIFFPFVISGSIVSWFAERTLRRGIDAGAWTESELEPARSWVEGRTPTLALLLTLLCLGTVAWLLGWSGMGFLPALVNPLGSLSRMRALLQRDLRISAAPTQRLPPLRSELWGR